MTAATDHTDVLIVGAGACGLTLAIDLARRGVDFRLIDRADAPFEGSRGKGIQPRSLEVYEDLGVLPGLMALGAAPYPMTRTYGEAGFVDEAVSEDRGSTPAEPFSRPLMLPQMLTERALRARLAELRHAPAFGCELLAFEDGGEGVVARVRVAGGEDRVVRARWMVGADGGRSFVRHALGVGFQGKTLPIRALVGDVRISGLSRDVWHRWAGGTEGQLALCPLAGTDLFQVQAVLMDEGEPDLSREGLAALIARRAGRDDLTMETVTWASPFGVNARLAERYRVGHVLLAGDAAHVHPPTGGQGLNTSVQDAYNLGWKLAAVLGGAPETLIDTYEAERRPIAAGVLGLSEALLSAAKANDMRRGRETQELDPELCGLAPRRRSAHGAGAVEGGRSGAGRAVRGPAPVRSLRGATLDADRLAGGRGPRGAADGAEGHHRSRRSCGLFRNGLWPRARNLGAGPAGRLCAALMRPYRRGGAPSADYLDRVTAPAADRTEGSLRLALLDSKWLASGNHSEASSSGRPGRASLGGGDVGPEGVAADVEAAA